MKIKRRFVRINRRFILANRRFFKKKWRFLTEKHHFFKNQSTIWYKQKAKSQDITSAASLKMHKINKKLLYCHTAINTEYCSIDVCSLV